jgi:hypothetical protein
VGRVYVRGRIGPLIGLGVGFHQEMSGRENVLVNGMLLGLTAKEVRRRFDQIVEFAELEKFIDTPVKFYSAGMFARLGFAVIAHIDPTILLVDEILAVGDARFQLRCFERLRDLQNDDATVLLVSHSMPMIRELCSRAVVIRRGQLLYDGPVEEAIVAHERQFGDAVTGPALAPVEFLERRFADGEADWRHVRYDEPVELEARIRFNQLVEDPVVTVGVVTNAGVFGGFNTTMAADKWRTFHSGEEASLRITFPARLGGGSYRLTLDVKERRGVQILARADDLVLTVAERAGSAGMLDVCARVLITDPSQLALEAVGEPGRELDRTGAPHSAPIRRD